MSNRARMTENFYEDCDVTYEFLDDSNEHIRISTTNPVTSLLFQLDFSPLCFTVYYEDGDFNPSMSPEELFDIHHAVSKHRDYNQNHILNHNWIDRFKTMINWQPGSEVYFQALPDDGSIIISIYSYTSSCSNKIDVDGFLCSRIRIPASRFHITDSILDITPKIVTGYQRVVCWYNMNLEADQEPYIFK